MGILGFCPMVSYARIAVKNHPARCDAGHAWHAIDDAEHHAGYAPNGVHDGHGADARPRIGGLVTRV